MHASCCVTSSAFRVPAVADAVTLVTKVWFDDMGYEPALAAARRSMQNLGCDRVDVLLIHFPGSVDAVQSPAKNRRLRADTWRALERLHADGHATRIGVSNWTRRHLRETLSSCTIAPQVLQTELHPRLQQQELVEDARAANMALMAFCPLAHGSPALLANPALQRIANVREDGATPAQLALRWSIDRGFIPIPKASSPSRLAENLRAVNLHH